MTLVAWLRWVRAMQGRRERRYAGISVRPRTPQRACPARPGGTDFIPIRALSRSVAEIELQRGRGQPQLAQRARLELPHPLARDAEPVADVLERPRRPAVEAE